jgi:hypothetical protein
MNCFEIKILFFLDESFIGAKLPKEEPENLPHRAGYKRKAITQKGLSD